MKRMFFFVLLVFIVGCETEAGLQTVEPLIAPLADKMTLMTDKAVYNSGETIHISLKIDGEIDNAIVKFYGIYDNTSRINETRIVDLNNGGNIITLEYRIPNHYNCKKINPGIYRINADVVYDGMITATYTDIEIRK